MLEEAGYEVEKEVETEQIEKTKEKIRTEFSEEELLAVWEQLKKVRKKGVLGLCKYVSPKKIQAI